MVRTLFLLVTVVLLAVSSAKAITIDDFTTASDQSVNGLPGQTLWSGFAAPQAVGGKRVLGVASVAGYLTARVVNDSQTGNHEFRHSQEVSSNGSTAILWDGSLTSAVDANGLGAIDLLEDGATAFKVRVNTFDSGFSTPILGRITVFDSIDPAGGVFSSVDFTLTQEIQSPQDVLVPFSGLVPSGGGADLSRIGAIRLEFFGQGDALDLSIDLFGTNGSCALVPGPSNGVIDECGVCGGDNSSCADCLGVPNGPAEPGTGCGTGLPGQCSQGTYTEACTCASVTPPSAEQCDSVDNDCDGAVDNGVGVCTDCSGTVGGSAVVDRCGVCNGNGLSCLGCTSNNLTDLLTALDGGAKRQEALIKKISRGVDAVAPARVKKQIAKMRVEAHRLQIVNWTLAWTVPVNSLVCENREFCVTASNQAIIDEYAVHSEELRRLGLQAVNLRKRYILTTRRVLDKFVFDVNELHAQNMALLATVPREQFTCS